MNWNLFFQNKRRTLLFCGTGVFLAAGVLCVWLLRPKPVDFNADIKPIFNKQCIICHGGVKRQGDFSLLFRSDALAPAKSGKRAIVPGDADHSELLRRVSAHDPEERMPYRHPALSKNEIALLRRWIQEGAPWGDHWAYTTLKPVPVPEAPRRFLGLLPSKESAWMKNDIDHFILEKMKRQGLSPSPEASASNLLRRVSLDLTGLPPTEAMAKNFLADPSQSGYEKLVDQLLASEHFGEKWASMWLDLARYADSKGYEKDGQRPEIWAFRDWVIRSFNQDKPYNTFLVEQLAGDLLPNPGADQFIATGFHRNTMTNDEGGTDNEEFRTAAVLDRVNTTWQALMGTTFGCVQCHSHPYDPFRHEEYYKFLAFFNNTRDEDTFDDYPLYRELDSADQQKLALLSSWLQQHASEDQVHSIVRFIRTWQPSINSIRADSFVNSALVDTKWLMIRNHGVARFSNVDLDGVDWLIYRHQAPKNGGTLWVHLDSLRGPLLFKTQPAEAKNWEITDLPLPALHGFHDLFFTYDNPAIAKPTDDGILFDWLYFTHSFPGKGIPGYPEAQKLFWELVRKPMKGIPILMENPRAMQRTTQVFERGNWLVRGKKVDPDVPGSLNAFPKNAPRNRLGLARWLVDPANPLVARTLVNRLWEQLFGTGLAETLEDLGTQGAPPTHRELLDYLAYSFIHDQAWSVKTCLKYIVLSATYRQDSKVSDESLAKDPLNKWYSRAPRVRLSAEEVRDQALWASGQLSTKLYGPPVMPWQPSGIWHSPYSGEHWETSSGQDQYRRALYTYWKRTAPYPSMLTFDGASREVCSARRIRTNTPLQALVTLNDSVYLDASRHLALRMSQAKSSPIEAGYSLLMYKPISPERLQALKDLFQNALSKFSADPASACEIVGQNDAHNTPETAALVVVASVLLNLDEVITKN